MAVFGDQAEYTTNQAAVHKIVGGQFTTPAGGSWEVQSITAYIYSGFAGAVKAAIYDTSRNLVANSQTSEVNIGATTAWYEFTFPGTKPLVSANTDYILVIWGSGATTAQYRRSGTGNANQLKSFSIAYTSNFPDSIAAWTTEANYTGSIYATINALNPEISETFDNWTDDVALYSFPAILEFTDDANNLQDALDPLFEYQTAAVGDLNTWADLIEQYYGIWQVLLVQSPADNFIVTSGKPPRNDWKDSIGLSLSPFGDLDIYVDDLRSMAADELLLELGILLDASLDNWADGLTSQHGSEALAYDTLYYNLFDEIIVNLHVPLTKPSSADTLSNWVDSVAFVVIPNFAPLADSLFIYDYLAMLLNYLLSVADGLSFSDSASYFSGVIPVASDTLDLNDSVAVALSSLLSTSVADSFTLTDTTVSPLLSTTFTSYIRRYLNDIVD